VKKRKKHNNSVFSGASGGTCESRKATESTIYRKRPGSGTIEIPDSALGSEKGFLLV